MSSFESRYLQLLGLSAKYGIYLKLFNKPALILKMMMTLIWEKQIFLFVLVYILAVLICQLGHLFRALSGPNLVKLGCLLIIIFSNIDQVFIKL